MDKTLKCPLCGDELTHSVFYDDDGSEAYLNCYCDRCKVVEFNTKNVSINNEDYLSVLFSEAEQIISHAEDLKSM